MSDDELKEEQTVAAETGMEDVNAKCEEYLAGWKRALADYDNLKKDLLRERIDLRRAAYAEAVQSLIPIVDNFEQALKFCPQTEDAALKNWLIGVMQVRVQLDEALKTLGVDAFGSVGDAFDPTLHESAGARTEAGQADGVVLEVVQRGWRSKDRVVRPAKVIINSL